MLSVVITAYNEVDNLPRAVASVKHLADEIVVVDTASTDATAAVAKKLGCKVYHHPYSGIVELARNFSISKAGGDWLLLLDADEEIPPDLASHIHQVVSQNRVDYCRLPRKNVIFGRWIKSDHWWPDYVYRLFKKGAISWQASIHSIPLTTGTGYDFPPEEHLAILHHNYQTVTQYIDRLNRYTDFQSRELFSSGVRFVWSDVVTKPFAEFLSQYFSRRGYQEGLHGLVLSLLQSFSQLIVYLKLWQQAEFPPVPVTPSKLVSVSSAPGREFWWWYKESRAASATGLSRWWWQLRRRLPL